MTTPILTNNELTLDSILTPPIDQLFRVSRGPLSHLPQKFEDVKDDLEHLMQKLAHTYTDLSCVHLHTDELVGSQWEKFSVLWDRGYFEKCRTRLDFFRRAKTCLSNHVKGQVQKYRGTAKRTGMRPPPRGTVPTKPEDFVSTKRVEVSLDDPESNCQPPCESEPVSGDGPDGEFDEFRSYLTPIEQLVYNTLQPPAVGSQLENEARQRMTTLATLKAERGADKNRKFEVKLTNETLAEGVGLDQEWFKKIEQSIRRKYEDFKRMDNDPELHQQEMEYNQALASLSEAFGVQVPRSLSKIVARRAMLLAARRNYDKLETSPELRECLVKVGLKVPSYNGLSLDCFGVLHDATDKTCRLCGQREACRVESATLGLDAVVLHPSVLGVKQIRIPTLIVNEQPQLPVANDRNDGILSYLNETFARSIINQDTYFRHRESFGAQRPPQIFCVMTSQPSEHIRLRFCNPSEELKSLLDKRRNGWYLPDTASVEEGIELIERHSSEVIRKVETEG